MFSRRFIIGILASTFVALGGVYAQNEEVSEIVQRIWTMGNGSQVSAKFVAKLGDTIKVEKYDGSIFNLSYQSLAEGDRNYVDSVVRKFGSAPGARTWSDINMTNFRGTFVRPAKSELEFMLLNEERSIKVETLFISDQDIQFILNELNQGLSRNQRTRRYRVWTYRDANQNELRSVGRYSRLEEDEVLLTQMDGSHLIPLSRLSKKDLDYIRSVDEYAQKMVDRILNVDTEEEAADEGGTLRASPEAPSVSPIWWLSLGLIFLLMLGLISIKYVYESGEREFDDDI